MTYILNSVLLFSLNLRSRAEYHATLKQKCKMSALWIYPNIFQPRQVRENIILPYRSPSDHLHDRVTCTYEVPLSSELQSIDPVLIQQMQSSAELTVHLTLSQTLPYRGLVYTDLVHSRESSAKLVKEQSQTEYAQIDHAKTTCVMISQHNLEEKEKGEHQWTLFVSNPKNNFVKNIQINSNLKGKW